MRKYPELKFKINKELDIKVGAHFLEHKKAGVDFGKGIILLHPFLKEAIGLPENQKQKIIEEYVGRFYTENETELIKVMNEFQILWEKKSQNFFSLVDEIFQSYPWPGGQYLAFPSIFNCNPRFLETKTFQVFWKHKRGPISVSAHEMLHFLFYDYFEKNLPRGVEVPNEKLWAISEIVDFFVLNSPSFRQLIEKEEKLYPDLYPLATKLRPLWEESKNFSDFFKASINLVQK